MPSRQFLANARVAVPLTFRPDRERQNVL